MLRLLLQCSQNFDFALFALRAIFDLLLADSAILGARKRVADSSLSLLLVVFIVC